MTNEGGRLRLAEQVRDARRRKNLTQEEAARLAGVDRKHYWKLENAKGDVTVETLRRIAIALEIDTLTLGPARVVAIADPRLALMNACKTAVSALHEVMRLVHQPPEPSEAALAEIDRILAAASGAPVPLDENHPTIRELAKVVESLRERK
jgi:transcriptional regulator with XRE-family HTH domain